jgi:hypothetical protein
MLACLCAGARAGELMDAVSAESRAKLDMVVRHAVEYDHCGSNQALDDGQIQMYVDVISEALAELPRYAELDADARRVLQTNLLIELQQAALAAPAPDCALARVGGQRV